VQGEDGEIHIQPQFSRSPLARTLPIARKVARLRGPGWCFRLHLYSMSGFSSLAYMSHLPAPACGINSARSVSLCSSLPECLPHHVRRRFINSILRLITNTPAHIACPRFSPAKIVPRICAVMHLEGEYGIARRIDEYVPVRGATGEVWEMKGRLRSRSEEYRRERPSEVPLLKL
jgi:hypothetical protein